MRFVLVAILIFGIRCQSEPTLTEVPLDTVESLSLPKIKKTKKIEKEPDVDVPPAFQMPGNLKNPPSHAESTPTGLHSLQLKEGDEKSESPNLNSVVTVRFSSWTPDGKLFQKSKDKTPFKQRVGNLLKGWQEGIVKMKKGEIRRFWIPGKLAYDNDPNSNSQKGPLIFDIELIDFKNIK